MTSFTLYTASSLGTFGVGFALLNAIGFDVPALALGGLVGRLSKKPRAPLDLMLAATLSHAVPATNALKLGPLLAPMQAAPKPDAEITPLERRVYAMIHWAEGPINQYGAPYMLVHWGYRGTDRRPWQRQSGRLRLEAASRLHTAVLSEP